MIFVLFKQNILTEKNMYVDAKMHPITQCSLLGYNVLVILGPIVLYIAFSRIYFAPFLVAGVNHYGNYILLSRVARCSGI